MVNPVEFVGGAALGTSLSLLCTVLEDLIHKNLVFASHFKDIQSRLQPLQLVFAEMADFNRLRSLFSSEVQLLNGLEKVLRDGKVLVEKCEKISSWNFIKRWRYENKLVGWEGDLTEQLPTIALLGLLKGMTNIQLVEILGQKVEKILRALDTSALFKAWTAVPELPPHPVGLDGPLKELKEKLLQDDGLSKLVLTGPAGCGKTTLVSKFCRDDEVKAKFRDNILFVTISKDPKMVLIVQQLFQQKGKKAPVFPSEESAAILLPKYLREEAKSPLLLVLDDVWPGSEYFLSKFDLQMTNETGSTLTSNYKVLVTSRSELKGFGSTHDVQLLDDTNAMELFHHSASLGDESSHIPEDVAKKIVTHCQGFPIALTVVGKLLSGEPEAVWRAKLTEWSRGYSSIVSEKELLRHLKSSIDELKKDMPIAEQCFLDFGLFPQNKYIPVATLFDMWRELYDLCDDNVCIAKLIELSSRSLATLVDGR